MATSKQLDDLYDDSTVDPTYHAKAHVLNTAIQNIGMGRYQVEIDVSVYRLLLTDCQYYLFICAGFGWFAYVHLKSSDQIAS